MRITSKRDKLRQYELAICKLRTAQIAMNAKLAQEAVHEILHLNKQFENEGESRHGN